MKKMLQNKKIWRAESQIDFLVQNMPDPFDIVDFDGYVLDINPAFEKVYGWKKNEIIQTPIRQCLVKNISVSLIHRVIARTVKKRRLPGFLFEWNFTYRGFSMSFREF